MNPGHTTLPVTSMVSVASSSLSPTATIRPWRMPTSATWAACPVPSTTVPPVSRRSSTSGPRQEAVGGRLDGGSFEEGRIGADVELHRIRERELLEGRLVDPLALDHLPRLGQDFGHV